MVVKLGEKKEENIGKSCLLHVNIRLEHSNYPGMGVSSAPKLLLNHSQDFANNPSDNAETPTFFVRGAFRSLQACQFLSQYQSDMTYLDALPTNLSYPTKKRRALSGYQGSPTLSVQMTDDEIYPTILEDFVCRMLNSNIISNITA